MNKKLAHLAKRRQLLIEQAAIQRSALARNVEPLSKPLAMMDRGLTIARYVKQHPALSIAASALFGLFRHTRAGRWLKSGLALFHMTRNLRDLLLKN